MRRAPALAGLLLLAGAPLVAFAQPAAPAWNLADILQRAGEKVEEYFQRAQSLVCLEVVRLQPLGAGLTPDGFGRTVESELRLAWDPLEGEGALEARTLRQVLRVNGGRPRKNDDRSCTTPEQQESETQPLSMMLPSQQGNYEFKLASPAKIDGRQVMVLTFRKTTTRTVEVKMVEGRDDCVSFDVDGGQRGRIWIDPDTFEVMRLDQSLPGLVEIPLPKPALRRAGVPASWIVERLDTSIRFQRVTFRDPDESIMLPASSTELRVTRGSGQPRLRTVTEYRRYQRFLTGARLVQQH